MSHTESELLVDDLGLTSVDESDDRNAVVKCFSNSRKWLLATRRYIIKQWVDILKALSDVAFYNPGKCISCFCITVLILSSGFYFGNLENDIYLLYAPSSSQSLQRGNDIAELFPPRRTSSLAFLLNSDTDIFQEKDILTNLYDFEMFIKSRLVVPITKQSSKRHIFNIFNGKSKDIVNHVTYIDLCEVKQGRESTDQSEYYGETTVPGVLEPQPYNRCGIDSVFQLWPRSKLGRPILTRLFPFIMAPISRSILNSDLVLINPEVEQVGQGAFTRIVGANGLSIVLYLDESDIAEQFESVLDDLIKDITEAQDSMDRDLSDNDPVIIINTFGQIVSYGKYNNKELETAKEQLESSQLMLIIPNLKLGILTPDSLANEVARGTALDTRLMVDYAISTVFLLTYGVMATATRDISRTKWWVGASGAIAALLGYIGGAGLMYLLNVNHTATANAVPFLVMGIGMDDAFVMLHSYSMSYYIIPKDDSERDAMRVSSKRCRVALSDSALAITLTTTTNIVTFTVGAFSTYQAARNFCLLAIGGLLGGYIASLFFFWPILCIASRREVSNKSSMPLSKCLVRCRILFSNEIAPHSDYAEIENYPINLVMGKLIRRQLDYLRIKSQIRYSNIARKKMEEKGISLEDRKHASQFEDDPYVFNNRFRTLLSWNREKLYNSFASHDELLAIKEKAKAAYMQLMPPKGNKGRFSQIVAVEAMYKFLRFRIVWFAMVSVYCGLTALILVTLYRDAKLDKEKKHIIPLDYLDMLYTIDGYSLIHSVPGYLMITKDDSVRGWEHPDVQNKMASLVQELSNMDSTSSYVSPIDIFMAWLNSGRHYGEWYEPYEGKPFDGVWQQGEFEFALYYWLHDVAIGQSLIKQVYWENGTNDRHILKAILIYYFNDFNKGFNYLMNDFEVFRGTISEFNDEPDIQAMEFNGLHPFYEADMGIRKQTLISMTTALLGIFIVTFVFMDDEYICNKYQIAAVSVVLLIDIAIFGLMRCWDLELNLLTYIQLVMSIGFGVDYTLHIAHQYNTGPQGTTLEKLASAMILIGTPLLNSFISTLGACLPLITRMDDYIFGTFLKMMVIVLTSGIVYGFGLLPVMLAILDYKNRSVRPFADIIHDYESKVNV